MMPPSWKAYLQKPAEEAVDAAENQRQTDHNDAAAKVVTAINSLSDAQKSQTSQEDRNEKKDRAISIATLFLVFLTVVFTFLTWWTLSGQLEEMKSAGLQTKQLIDANGKLVDAATKQANAAIENVQTARENFVASERAWVGPRNAKSNNAPTIDNDLSIILEYGNTGREPAIETVYDANAFTVTDEEDKAAKSTQRISDFIGKCKIMWKPDNSEVVYPSVGLSAASYSRTTTVDKSDIDDDVVSGAKTIIFTGCFSYKTTQTIHRSWFCYYFKAGKTQIGNWNICRTGNGAD